MDRELASDTVDWTKMRRTLLNCNKIDWQEKLRHSLAGNRMSDYHLSVSNLLRLWKVASTVTEVEDPLDSGQSSLDPEPFRTHILGKHFIIFQSNTGRTPFIVNHIRKISEKEIDEAQLNVAVNKGLSTDAIPD